MKQVMLLIYELSIFKGLFYPNQSFYQLAKAETIERWRLRISFLLLVSAAIFSLSGWLGVGSQALSPALLQHSPAEYESLRGFFIIGRCILGLLFAGVFLTLPALCFSLFSHETFSKFVMIQAILLPILLLEQISYIILALRMDLPWYSSPFSLGVIGQYSTNYTYVIFLLGTISIFKIWVMVMQYRGLKPLIHLGRFPLILLIFTVHLISWCGTSAIAMFNFVNLL
ncbi:hypothetical protein [Bacillus sp. SD088]|uniref:hypothetical protein n=1 Tax=Bacillus sp. SD088 TaxID=2782012 RepID=UPI001A970768|nr:hypothetical protein [Bacillus sp. SD088]MBO0991489.1 hypothetical protein [Bacillus sp. SD088]